nr:MAG TPA: hypothetical protein [Caudoviricetes sp.]
MAERNRYKPINQKTDETISIIFCTDARIRIRGFCLGWCDP